MTVSNRTIELCIEVDQLLNRLPYGQDAIYHEIAEKCPQAMDISSFEPCSILESYLLETVTIPLDFNHDDISIQHSDVGHSVVAIKTKDVPFPICLKVRPSVAAFDYDSNAWRKLYQQSKELRATA